MDDKGFFMRLLEGVGLAVAHFVEEMGRIMVFFTETLLWLFRPPLNLRNIFKQMEEIGVNSVGVVIIMASFTGMVLALQSYTGFKRFNAESLVGTVVALSMTRELGPVLTRSYCCRPRRRINGSRARHNARNRADRCTRNNGN